MTRDGRSVVGEGARLWFDGNITEGKEGKGGWTLGCEAHLAFHLAYPIS